jgi:hypothetical protein
MFNSIITNGTLTLTSVLICIMVDIILGVIISLVHMKTSKYSKNFIITLSILPLLVSIVMMMVNGNLGTSVAILGAFSLIRFRSLPGNSREIANVFWAMAIGLAVGMGQVYFAILVTAMVSILLLIFYKTNFGNEDNSEQILRIVIPEDLDYEGAFNDIFSKYTTKTNLIKVETTNLGSLFELKYLVILKENIKVQDFINELRVRNGNLKINLSHPNLEEAL